MNQRDNSGALFKNLEKQTDKHPDYSGSCVIAGKELRIAAWIKEGKAGKFMSLAFSEPRQGPPRTCVDNTSAQQDGPAPF